MQLLAVATILIVLLSEYLQKKLGLPRQVIWLPEIASMIAVAIVVSRLAATRFRDVDARYLIVFGLLLVHVILGILLNHLEPGVIFSGVRIYLKALPFFFLPIVLAFKERDLKLQLLLIGAVCLIQFPIAWDQRMAVAFRGGVTGDEAVGTLANPATLAVFLCCVASVTLACYLRKKISLWMLVAFFAVALPATMVNETKGTLLLLPLALLVPSFFIGRAGFANRMKQSALTIVLIAAFLSAFIPVYDYFAQQRWGYGILDFLTMEGRVENYLLKDADLGSQKIGKLDTLRLPFIAAARDPTQIAFGLGIGNVSPSFLGEGFTGAYFDLYGHLIGPAASFLLWEVGLIGILYVLVLMYFIFRDALVAREDPGLAGALALGWTGVIGIMFLAMFYNNTIDSNAVSYLFWYFSGVVAATSVRVRRAAAESNASRHEPPVIVQPISNRKRALAQRADGRHGSRHSGRGVGSGARLS